MSFSDLQTFLAHLERRGDLRRVTVEVDPELEITEIATRVVKEDGPALLFEKVKGSSYPLAINILGSMRRIEWALGMPPARLGEMLVNTLERLNPPSLKGVLASRQELLRLLAARKQRVRRGLCQQVVEPAPDLARLPALKCWPGDGGRFITFPLVLTQDPATHRTNLAVYRLHVYDGQRTGMHWQLQKGGGFHYHEAEKRGQPLEVAAVLGGDPALMLSAVLPLPEGLEELAFSGFLRGKPTRMVRARSISLEVPANAEFVLEGIVPPQERAQEGPFGDHFGHYSDSAPFPVFHVKTITHRRSPVYPAAVVGKPPQEDRAMGDAVQEIMRPLVRIIQPEVRDMWAYFEAGFHNLLVVSVESRYAKEPMKTALGLLGNGQVSLTKCCVLVDAGVNVRDFSAVLREVRDFFRPEHDFLLIPRVPLDTLDFTSFKMHLGSKMVLDATRTGKGPEPHLPAPRLDPRRLCPQVLGWRLLEETMLVVQVQDGARDVLTRLLHAEEYSGLKLLAAVSPDVNLEDQTGLLWGIFTRFDPARDIQFPRMELVGAAPVYRGTLGIDATWKPGYPRPLEMDPAIRDKVDKRWEEYWR
jgi:4-hydroxy-3-polyprenylbenzoate decarboxylase